MTQASTEKNAYRRRLVKKYGKRRSDLKAKIYDRSLSPDERFSATLLLAKLPRNSAKNRVRNRCALTGRPRGYYRKFQMSRITFRELASRGLIPGVTKASW